MPREPKPHAPESQDPDDHLIVSKNLNGRYPWRDPAKQVPYGIVLIIAARLKWSPADVLVRLGALGYADVQRSKGPLPDAVEPDDAALIMSVESTYGLTPVDVDKTVPLRQIIESAARAARSPADVARRMGAYGFQVGTGVRPLPESADPRDVALIRTSRRGGWLDWDDEVSAQHVLGVAQELACSPRVAAERLTELGLRLPYTPEPADERILRIRDTASHRWIGRWTAAPVGHVLAVARDTGRSREDILARLGELGCQPPDGNVPDSPEADDLVILSENLDGRAPWLWNNTVVGLQVRHILRAARITGRTPASVRERLTALGHWLHENAGLPETVDEADIALLDTVTRSYLDDVHLESVLRSASLTGRSPADVAARLTALGYRLPDEVEYPEIRGVLR
ncbi:wHTH domain-containing protein [Streptomyces sp. NBC_01716]|uniref:wHTH domain-containing protein n=1 Tax=Streptomyces sp. NBC_01716 TaxID=2975917 RepID=UPI002E2ECF92|nr:hypothetical protein [Streptomyces sp. NBC_01716]